MSVFTFIFPFRDRDILRVEKCLESLKSQTISNFTVFLVDFGSREELRKELSPLISRYSFCHLIRLNTYGRIWCKPTALNAGLAKVKTPFVITTDIDMIFSPGFMKYITSLADLTDRLFMQCYYLPEDRSNNSLERIFSINSVALSKLELSEKDVAFGGFQCTSTETLRFIGGYDPFYTFWGAEDNDVNKRLAATGQQGKWGNPEIAPYFHLWHPKVSSITSLANPKGWNEYLHLYRKLNNTVVRKDDSCNYNYNSIDRPIDKYLTSRMIGDIKILKYFPVEGPLVMDHFQLQTVIDMMKKGEVLQLRYINRNKYAKKALLLLFDRLIESIRWRFKIDIKYNRNSKQNEELSYFQAKDNLLWLILDLKSEHKIIDYHLLYDDCELNAYLMK